LASGVSHPISPNYIVLIDNRIVSDKPWLDLNLHRDFSFPQVFERYVNLIATEILIHGTYTAFTIFYPVPNWISVSTSTFCVGEKGATLETTCSGRAHDLGCGLVRVVE
jgi:hypothetical protein